MMNVEIKWVREPHPSIAGDKRVEVATSFQVDQDLLNLVDTLNEIYRDTNLYCGEFWDALEPLLPEDRPHTALSVGDRVKINGLGYEIAELGWKPLLGEW